MLSRFEGNWVYEPTNYWPVKFRTKLPRRLIKYVDTRYERVKGHYFRVKYRSAINAARHAKGGMKDVKYFRRALYQTWVEAK